jgi:hypothetical protein
VVANNNDRRGAALPQEDVGEHVGVNHVQKVCRKGGNGNHSAKRQALAALRYVVLAVADFAMPFGGVGESCFLSIKVAIL